MTFQNIDNACSFAESDIESAELVEWPGNHTAASDAVTAPTIPQTRGCMRAAVAAGFPAELVLPIIPYDADLVFVQAHTRGKQPGIRRQADDGSWQWSGVKGWQHGVVDEKWARAAADGANAGLLMGRQPAGGNAFLFIDLDPETDRLDVAQAFSARVIKGVVAGLGTPLWIRRSRPGRAGILVKLPPGDADHKKMVYPYTAAGGTKPFAKIELLATGQQAVIGGIHQSGCAIEAVPHRYRGSPITASSR